MEELTDKIHDILGTMEYPELIEIKTKRIILLFQMTMIQMLKDNTYCSPFCKGFGGFEDLLHKLDNDENESNRQTP